MPEQKPKILILAAHIGHGHINAAKATKEAIDHLYPNKYQTEIIDLLEVVNKSLKKTTEALYIKTSKYLPQFNRLFFEHTDNQTLLNILNKINYPLLATKLKKFLAHHKPSLIISTFPVWDKIFHQAWQEETPNTLFINIITDSINIHKAWITGHHDYHIVPNQDSQESLIKMKIDHKKIKTLGFPISLKYLKKANKQQIFKKLKLQTKFKTILYLAVDETSTKIISQTKSICKNTDHQVIIVTGRNKKVTPILKKNIKEKQVKIFGWVNNLHELIQVSDIVITKAGGSTTMEVIAMEKPLIITKILAGQEEGNAELIRRHNLGIILSDKNLSIPEAIQEIATNQEKITTNLKKESNPKAALKIASFTNSLLEN